MKFRNVNSALISACEEASRFLQLAVNAEFIELFSVEGKRNLAQNSKMWPLLADISRDVTWLGEKHDTETWKCIISAAWKSQEFVCGISDTVVVLPVRTSKLSKSEFAELIEAIYAFGSEQSVQWSDPALKAYEKYREAA